MSSQGKFYVPGDGVLKELGRLQIVHSHLDHVLRLSIKRMLGISIDDRGYWNETRGMAAELRKRTRTLIAERYANNKDIADTLNKVLDEAEEVTLFRNRALHSVWMISSNGEPVLHDRNDRLRLHISFRPPSAEDIASTIERIQRVQSTLNQVTRALL